ncbi:lipopolysaccharide-induced tumor necrosis factor-alpha factor-like isoform X2 [Papilio machaon]|uniref:lipopolysaccharide-induced tumor necrosis factor-alpha factor-like isoform X2 n=1 Tax=Papilio machaon TaxID=76193 RepID=UPI001E663D99|nr:lipopolysaccharide-induced tumor necrosis factor-alpha factor-like isoform X2 [Papilio machaon]
MRKRRSKDETSVYNGTDTFQHPPTAPPPYPGLPNPEPTNPGPSYPGSQYSGSQNYRQPQSEPASHPRVVQGPNVVHVQHVIPTVIPTVVVGHRMGPNSTAFVCKSCNHQIVTRVERNASLRTHLVALFLCFVGCWPFACLPYCMDSCNNADHYCTNCGAYIGSYTG